MPGFAQDPAPEYQASLGMIAAQPHSAVSHRRLASLRSMMARPARRLQAPTCRPGWKTAPTALTILLARLFGGLSAPAVLLACQKSLTAFARGSPFLPCPATDKAGQGITS